MPFYETTFIINPQADDATIDRQVKAVSDLITQSGGKIIMENRMGTRKLAYLIGDLAQGYYANLVFETVVETLIPLDKHFRLNEEYVRNLTVRYERDPYVELEKKKERESSAISDRPERPGSGPRGVGTPRPVAGATADSKTEAKQVKPESVATSAEPKPEAKQVKPESIATSAEPKTEAKPATAEGTAAAADSKPEAKPAEKESAAVEETVKPDVPSKTNQEPVESSNDDENEL